MKNKTNSETREMIVHFLDVITKKEKPLGKATNHNKHIDSIEQKGANVNGNII